MIEHIGKSRFVYRSSHSKVKASDLTNFYNQAFNSHAAVFEVYLVRAKTRLVCFFADIKKKTRVA